MTDTPTIPAETPEAVLLQICPFCDYSLHGLPVEHRCPECGLPVLRRAVAFGGMSRWHAMRTTGRVLWLVGLAWLMNILASTQWSIRQPSGIVMRIAVLFFWAWFFCRYLFRQEPDVLVVGPDGILAGNRKKKSAIQLTWDRIRDARLDWRDRLILETDDEQIRLGSWDGFVNHKHATQCRDCVLAWLRRRGADR